jgi:hypothetical protein
MQIEIVPTNLTVVLLCFRTHQASTSSIHNVRGSNGGEGTQDRAAGDLVVLIGLIHLHHDAPSCIALYCTPLLLSSLSTAASHELGHIHIIWP